MFSPSINRLLLLLVLMCIGQVFAQSYPKEVVAKKGDGIYTILSRNGLNSDSYFAEFVELNEKNIGKNYSLYEGRSYLLPEKKIHESSSSVGNNKVIRNYAIFGPDYSNVEIIDNTLKGAIFYLMAGHGGPDPGALGKYGKYTLSEDEYAYDVTIRLARKLIEHNALVYLIVRDNSDGIRDEPVLKMDQDETVYKDKAIPRNQNARLKQRTKVVNNLYAKNKGAYQRLITIHVDSRGQGENLDVFFYHHEKSKSGKSLANNIHKTFKEKYAHYQPNRTYSGSVSSRSNLYVIRNTHPATVFIELGNIRNGSDQRRFVIPDNRQALANWIGDGLILDYSSR